MLKIDELFYFLILNRPLSKSTAAVIIYYKRKNVIDIQKTPLMPFNELLGNFLTFLKIVF